MVGSSSDDDESSNHDSHDPDSSDEEEMNESRGDGSENHVDADESSPGEDDHNHDGDRRDKSKHSDGKCLEPLQAEQGRVPARMLALRQHARPDACKPSVQLYATDSSTSGLPARVD